MVLALRQSPPSVASQVPEIPASTLDVLNDVRAAAIACRAAARTDIFKACALLSTGQGEARSAFAKALVKCLTQALGKAPVFFRPGVAELSYDEFWLTSALRAAQTGDRASLTFLLRSRVRFEHRRAIGFLIHGLVPETNLE